MLRYLWIAAVVFALDQASKLVAVELLIRHAEVNVLPFLNFTLVYNAGAAFGFLSNAPGWQNPLFVVVALIACALILVMVKRLGVNEVQVAVGLTLVLGGAAGNLADRLRYGYVVDFIDFFIGSWHFWTFNVADSAITIGAILLLLDASGLGFRKRHS